MATSSRVENVMMTAQERHGHIFSLTDKQRMEQAFRIPNLEKLKTGGIEDPTEYEKEIRWQSATQLIETLNQGHSIREAERMLNITVSPLHFAQALLASRQADEIRDSLVVAAMFGIDVGQAVGRDDDGADKELLSSVVRGRSESVEDFKRRLMSDLSAHVARVSRLHDELFSFKKYRVHIGKTKVMPAPGRAPLGREVRGHKTVPDCHSELWLSYQDELVTEASDYFKTKPWQRMTDRNRQHMQGMADKFEDLRKSRQKAEAKIAAELRLLDDLESQGHVAPKGLASTLDHLADTVMNIQTDMLALEHNAASACNRRFVNGLAVAPPPLSAYYSGTFTRVDTFDVQSGFSKYADKMLPKEWATCRMGKQIRSKSYLDLSHSDHQTLARHGLFLDPLHKTSDPADDATSQIVGQEKRGKVMRQQQRGMSSPVTPATKLRERETYPTLQMQHPYPLLDNPEGVDHDILRSYDTYARNSKLTSAYSGGAGAAGVHAHEGLPAGRLVFGQDVPAYGGQGDRERVSCLGFAAPYFLSPDNPGLAPITPRAEDSNGTPSTYLDGMPLPKATPSGQAIRGEIVGVQESLSEWVVAAAERLADAHAAFADASAGLGDRPRNDGPGGLQGQGFTQVLNGGLVGVSSPAYSPIFVCSQPGALEKIMDATPEARLCDLVLLQGGQACAPVRRRLEHRRCATFDRLFNPRTHRPKEEKMKEDKHSGQMLAWLETRKMLGSVHAEVRRLEGLHRQMLQANNSLSRALDAVSEQDGQADGKFVARIKDDRGVDGVKEEVTRNKIGRVGPITNKGKNVEESSQDFRTQLAHHRNMINEVETEIWNLRKALKLDAMPVQAAQSSPYPRRCEGESDPKCEITLVVLNFDLVGPSYHSAHRGRGGSSTSWSESGVLIYDSSYVHGRHAHAVRDLLHVMRVDVEEVSSDDLDARAWLKILWDSCMWLLSVTFSCNVRHIMTTHYKELEALVHELAPIAQEAHFSGARAPAPSLHSLLSSTAVMNDFSHRARQYHVGEFTPLNPLQYLKDKACTLVVTVLRARNLLAADRGGTSDPYFRLHIGDTEKECRKTQVMKKTLAPEYNETLKLPVKPTHRRASLKIECFDHDVLSADDSLGACTIDLEPLVLGTEYHTWLKLEGGEDSHGHAIQNNNGEVELRYKLVAQLAKRDEAAAIAAELGLVSSEEWKSNEAVLEDKEMKDAGAREGEAEAMERLRWLNGYLLSLGQTDRQPYHVKLLTELGVDVQKLCLHADADRMRGQSINCCLAAEQQSLRSCMTRAAL